MVDSEPPTSSPGLVDPEPPTSSPGSLAAPVLLAGCLHVPFQRKSAETAEMLRSSVNTQAASHYRALFVSLLGLDMGGDQEINSSPHPWQHCCKASNSDTGRGHTHHLLAQDTGHLCWSLGSGESRLSLGFITHPTHGCTSLVLAQ